MAIKQTTHISNIIPNFIKDNFNRKIYSGSFTAPILFLDISGFTTMTEKLMKKGKEGAEILSSVINEVFDPVIEAVYAYGGFISSFAGDGFTVLFIDCNDPLSIFICSKKIEKLFKEKKAFNTKFGKFILHAKIGLSWGEVEWGIIGLTGHKTYFFRGSGITGAINSEERCSKGEIIFDRNILELITTESIEFIQKSKNHFQLLKVNRKNDLSLYKNVNYIDQKLLLNFFPPQLLKINYLGEFREIATIFISFDKQMKMRVLNTLVSTVIEVCDEMGGYFNRIDFGDKGGIILILFGVPVSFEDNLKRALDFMWKIREKYPDSLKAGITSSIAFTGFIGSSRRAEYTAYGDQVNQAVRLMSKAGWGQVLVEEKTADKMDRYYQFSYLKEIFLKGKSKPVLVCQLLDKKINQEVMFFKGDLIGRVKEKRKLKKHCLKIIDEKFRGIVYVHGEPGIGKSRLVYEVLTSLDMKFNVFTLQTDSILKQSLNPFNFFFRNFFLKNCLNREKNSRNIFEQQYNLFVNKFSKIDQDQVEQLSKELIRLKSIFAALVGIHWKDSLYEILDAKGKFENTSQAIKVFFKAQSLLKPLIILLEDSHWLDEDSKIIIGNLIENIEDFPLSIVATSRFNDDGSKSKLSLGRNILQVDIILGHLDDKNVSDFIFNQFNSPADEDLKSFIKTKSGGNPFYIEQFCLFLKENNLVELDKGEYKLKEQSAIELPTSINSVIIARLDRLSLDLKQAVKTASVLGREIDVEIFFELFKNTQAKFNRNKFKRILKEGKNEQIWMNISEIKYLFKHALLQEAAYQMQLKRKLRELHDLTAEIMEKKYLRNKEKYAQISYHYLNAENFDKAAEYSEKAADYFKQNYRNREAISYYNQLLNILNRKKFPEKATEILLKKGSVLQFIGEWDGAEKIFKSGLEIVKKTGNKIHQVDLLNSFGLLYINRGQNEQSEIYLKKSISIAEKVNYLKGLNQAKERIGLIYYNKGEFSKAMKFYKERLKISKDMGIKSEIGKAYGNIGILFSIQGDYKKAMQFYKKQIKISEKLNDKNLISKTIGNMGNDYSSQGNYTKAMECYQIYLKISEELGDKQSVGRAYGNMGRIYFEQGNFSEAIKYYLKEIEICKENGEKRGLSIATGNLGVIYFDQGKYDKAKECYQKKIDICEEIGHRQGYAITVNNLANLYQVQGNYDEALRLYKTSIRIGRELGIKHHLCNFLLQKAKLLYEISNFNDARILIEEALKIAEEVNRTSVIFNSKLLINKMDGNIQGLIDLLDENRINEIRSAVINYELWKLTGKQIYRISAIKFYKKIYKKTETIEYKLKIKELSDVHKNN